MMHAFVLAQGALREGNPARAAALLRAADRFSPGHPLVLYGLAQMSGLAGDTATALAALERLRLVGVVRDVLADTTMRPLRASPRFQRLAREIAAAAAPLVRSDTAFTVADPDLIPESVTRDPATGTFLLGSMYRRKVVGVPRRGEPADLLGPAQDGLGEVLGMHVDSTRGLLWVASWVRDSLAPRGVQGTAGWGQLHVYDLASRRLLRRLAPRDSARPHLLNDVALAADGSAYVSDSEGSMVWRVRAGADTLERFYEQRTDFIYPNGIALTPDGRRLYVAHLEGLTLLDPATGRATRVHAADGAFVGGIDGLYACRDGLVGIQNVYDHTRVVRIRLSAAGDSATAVEVLERRHPAMNAPTTGEVVGDALYYVANSQLPRLRGDGTLATAERPSPTVVLRLPLGAACR